VRVSVIANLLGPVAKPEMPNDFATAADLSGSLGANYSKLSWKFALNLAVT
jgi:hypothetical protein